jgi:hypothetical protein
MLSLVREIKPEAQGERGAATINEPLQSETVIDGSREPREPNTNVSIALPSNIIHSTEGTGKLTTLHSSTCERMTRAH